MHGCFSLLPSSFRVTCCYYYAQVASSSQTGMQGVLHPDLQACTPSLFVMTPTVTYGNRIWSSTNLGFTSPLCMSECNYIKCSSDFVCNFSILLPAPSHLIVDAAAMMLFAWRGPELRRGGQALGMGTRNWPWTAARLSRYQKAALHKDQGQLREAAT